MEGRRVFLVLLSVVVSISLDCVSGSVLEVSVRPGDNVTIYCDCRLSTGVFVMWFRNCFHENQPPLILKTKSNLPDLPHRFHFVRNFSSESYDLLIQNISASDEGFYYCGTEQQQVEYTGQIIATDIYSYGNITTKIMLVLEDSNSSRVVPAVSWSITTMVVTPVCTLLSSISFILIYHFFQKKDFQIVKTGPDSGATSGLIQDEECVTRVLFQPKKEQTDQ